MKNKNSSIRCIVVLLVISVVCVTLLAVLNDVLYVAPDTSVFTKAYSGKYEITAVQNVAVSNDKIELTSKGTADDGKNVVGIYATGNKYGKADSFSVAIIVDMDSKKIVGVHMITDGSTGGYSYDATRLNNILGATVDKNFLEDASLLQTKATNSSIAVRQAIAAAAEYYIAVYGG